MAERYKIYDQLGAGGVGAVFRAYDNELKRWVAIKRLMSANDASGDQTLAAELRREADALASLRNPNIVTIFDVASDSNGLFMVMELLEGEDLADVVARGPLHYDDFKELASQTLEALLAAHQRHILHRDIKPENIKVERLPGGRMQSKIIDFGLARAGMRARKQTEDQEGTVMGSIFYMAPEQLTRAPVDVRTDLYSLGCVFYEALSGRKAFDGESMNAVIDRHINHDIIPQNLVAPHVPPWLGAWVLRLMALNPDDRPENAQQAIEEFRAWEKMSAAPPMMPWMPPGYAQGQQGAYTQPMYPPGTVTTSSVPIHPGYYQPQEAYAQPVLEVVPDAAPITEMAAYTTPLARPGPGTGPRPVGHRTGPSPRLAPTPPPSPSSRLRPAHEHASTGSNGKIIIGVIGGIAAVILAGAWFFFSGKKDPTTGVKASVITSSAPPKVTYMLPQDRLFPPADADIVLHAVAGVGGTGKSDNLLGLDNPVINWHDIAPLGNDNILVAYEKDEGHAPKRVYWPTPKDGVIGAKASRSVLDFRPRNGKPQAMALSETGDETSKFPFGSSPPRGEIGMTLGVVFQADAASLPTRVLTLSGDNNTSVSLRVEKDKNVIVQFRNGSDTSSVSSKEIDATQPCTVIITWQGATGATEVRVKDAPGKTFKGNSKTGAPAHALNKLQIG
ncbi:MAG TPA: serine/threonine-protein kinase, partial [Prosthecobacter sp.]